MWDFGLRTLGFGVRGFEARGLSCPREELEVTNASGLTEWCARGAFSKDTRREGIIKLASSSHKPWPGIAAKAGA